MNPTLSRLRLAVVLLAWLAQALMPVAHAAVMNADRGANQAWCGDPSSASEALALLPAEVRHALDEGSEAAGHFASCAALCAVGTTPLLPPGIAPVAALRAAGLEPGPAPLARPATRSQSPTPPAHAPPAFG
ncbi:MAG: hypothetical protein ABW051_07330 [Burkholderiaceae bacterium]